jgi:hypothetical protein
VIKVVSNVKVVCEDGMGLYIGGWVEEGMRHCESVEWSMNE